MRSFLSALAFLTILPIRFREMPGPATVAASRFWYPAVGLLLAALVGGWTELLAAWLRSPALTAFLVLILWVVLTGALHLDGFCDLCDGLLGGRSPERRLEILKDPHLGTFGLAGGVLLLLGKFVAIQELVAAAPGLVAWGVGSALISGRCLVLCLAAGAIYPRSAGTGKVLIEAVRPWEFLLFAGLGWLGNLVATPAFDLGTAGFRFSAALLAVLLLKWSCQKRLGGLTGDCLGAGIELVELVSLLSFLIPIMLR